MDSATLLQHSMALQNFMEKKSTKYYTTQQAHSKLHRYQPLVFPMAKYNLLASLTLPFSRFIVVFVFVYSHVFLQTSALLLEILLVEHTYNERLIEYPCMLCVCVRARVV